MTKYHIYVNHVFKIRRPKNPASMKYDQRSHYFQAAFGLRLSWLLQNINCKAHGYDPINMKTRSFVSYRIASVSPVWTSQKLVLVYQILIIYFTCLFLHIGLWDLGFFFLTLVYFSKMQMLLKKTYVGWFFSKICWASSWFKEKDFF